jgi:hypothetical protein
MVKRRVAAWLNIDQLYTQTLAKNCRSAIRSAIHRFEGIQMYW